MDCPTCTRIMLALGCTHSGRPLYHCPRCGTLVPCNGEPIVPSLAWKAQQAALWEREAEPRRIESGVT